MALLVRVGESLRVPRERSADGLQVERDRGRALDRGILAFAVAIGIVLRVIELGKVGFNSDEAVYAGQAASLAGNPHYVGMFPIVRAHPLLFQMLASPLYRSGVHDVPGRYLSAAFGVATIVLVFQLGKLLYGRRAGAIASLLLAVMPYHVVITRQVVLDGPMTFFGTAAFVCLAALGRTEQRRWLIAAGACLGLAALTKETAVVLIGSVFVFLSLSPVFWRPVRYVVGATAAAVALTLTYPLVTAVSGAGHSGQSYLAWQLSRRPNHDLLFYLTVVPAAMGVLLIAAAAVGFLLLRHRVSWPQVLLVSWIVVPLVFFEAWPVKGFPYLVLIAPAVAVLAARTLAWLVDRDPGRWVAVGGGVAATGAVVASLLVPSTLDVLKPATAGLAGTGGTPGGREAGLWIEKHLPAGTRLMTLGPSMSNIIEYYGGHRADGLSVSANPLHRNPSYVPIPNADVALRTGQYLYIVWDAYSAKRSPNFAAKELTLVRKYSGRAIHTELATFGGKAEQPVVVIYQVQP